MSPQAPNSINQSITDSPAIQITSQAPPLDHPWPPIKPVCHQHHRSSAVLPRSRRRALRPASISSLLPPTSPPPRASAQHAVPAPPRSSNHCRRSQVKPVLPFRAGVPLFPFRRCFPIAATAGVFNSLSGLFSSSLRFLSKLSSLTVNSLSISIYFVDFSFYY